MSHRFPTYVFDNNVPAYFEAVFSQHYFKEMLENISPGGAGRNRVLNRKDFLRLPCYIPPISEQQIAEILKTQDKVIELYNEKIGQLHLLKKNCLRKMFPQNGASTPEIRFSGFTDTWEQRKFEDIVSRTSTISCENDLPRVEYEDIVSGAGCLNKDIYAKKSEKSGIMFRKGDVLYGKLRPYLQNWLLPSFNGLAVGDFWVLQPQKVDSRFLYRLIQSREFEKIANQSTGTKMPRADWKLVSKAEFAIPPSYDEQAAIGTYFNQLDHLITLYQRMRDEERTKKKP